MGSKDGIPAEVQKDCNKKIRSDAAASRMKCGWLRDTAWAYCGRGGGRILHRLVVVLR